MTLSNPYQQPDVLATGLRAYQGVRDIQRADEAASGAAEDRTYQRGLRAEADRLRDRNKQLEEPVADVLATRESDKVFKGRQRAMDYLKMSAEEAGMLTPDEARAGKARTIEDEGLKMDATRANIDQSRAATASSRASAAKTRQEMRDTADDKITRRALIDDYNTTVQRLGSYTPEVSATIQDAFIAFNDQDPEKVKALAPKLIPVLNTVAADEIKKSKGLKLRSGETIDDVDIENIYESPDPNRPGMVFSLSITARGKDGKKRLYPAPATSGRGEFTGDPAQLLVVPYEQAEDWLTQAAAGYHDVDRHIQGGGTAAQLKEQKDRITRGALMMAGAKKEEVEALIGAGPGATGKYGYASGANALYNNATGETKVLPGSPAKLNNKQQESLDEYVNDEVKKFAEPRGWGKAERPLPSGVPAGDDVALKKFLVNEWRSIYAGGGGAEEPAEGGAEFSADEAAELEALRREQGR